MHWSVRAMMRVDEPMTSHWRRAALRRSACSRIGTKTLPPMWPHFFVPGDLRGARRESRRCVDGVFDGVVSRARARRWRDPRVSVEGRSRARRRRRQRRERGDGVDSAGTTPRRVHSVDDAAPTPSPRAPRLSTRGAVDAIAATVAENPKSKTNHNTEHGLVLEVHAGRARLDHELRELHDRREATVARVAVGDDRRQVIDVLTAREGPAVVVLQGLEELVDLLRDRIIRIVREIRTGLVGRGRRRRALPSRNVDGRELGRHGRGLDGVEGAVGARVAARRGAQVQSLEELLGRRVLVRRFSL